LSGPLRNFQLPRWITVPGTAPNAALPPFRPVVTVDGYRFVLTGSRGLRAVQANFMTVKVTRPDGTPATFTPWFGALAHAIFFRAGTLDYFHTLVRSEHTCGWTSVCGPARVTRGRARAAEQGVEYA